ncbi:N-acetyltransferase [Polynucleobacter sp. JS-Mosq-20-D10]|uniref:acyltransferase n=1 Tax=Polynucleobacter sp. JS-Mosq-20-D10 TaxID=2576922 RepID=UPI001BFDD345|nr:acyltransferase [Polynucleobacter sp. JS-Mosq-20-D10]QWE00790.1 N-acetyltransferase [Polynucleobacter sp. JS-Mosq-20-D10]
MSAQDRFIHLTANVDKSAVIDAGSKIWINVQIREHAKIGKNCIISKDSYIDHGVIIGNDCKIQNSVSIYNGVTIEDEVFIGPNAAFTNDRVPRAFNKEWKTTSTLVKQGASIGANATIICGVTIGEYSMVAAGAVVTKNVAPYTLVAGNPAKVISKIDRMGNKIKGMESDE